jgi:hypothetical protein
LLNTLAIKLKEGRMRAGALSLSSPELKIHLDTNEGAPEPIDVEQKQQLETNSLVEEFMLLANISVAKKIQEAYPQTAVLRRHLPPPKTNFETLQDILQKKKGMTLEVTSSKALAESLDRCVVSTMKSFENHADPSSDPLGAGIQYVGTNHGDSMHVGGRVLLLWQCIKGYFRSLRSGQSHLHAFHSKSSLRQSKGPKLISLAVTHSTICRCTCSSTTCSCNRLHTAASVFAIQVSRRANPFGGESTT